MRRSFSYCSCSHKSSSHSSPLHSPLLSPPKSQSPILSEENDNECTRNNQDTQPLDYTIKLENLEKPVEGSTIETEKAGTLLSMAVDKILSNHEEESIDVMEGFMISKKGKVASDTNPQISPSPILSSHNTSFSSVNTTPTVIKLPLSLSSSTFTSPMIAPSPINFDHQIVPQRLSLLQRSPSTILNPLPLPPTKVDDNNDNNTNNNNNPPPFSSSCGYPKCSVCLNGTPPGFNNSPYPTWADICYTALYVLTINFPDQKFFHIKKDICKYIDEHFEVLCLRERTSIWKQTVNMTLSHPQYFKMFQQESALENGRKGYYGLKFLQDPYLVPEKPKKIRKRKNSTPSSDIEQEFPHRMQESQNITPLFPASPNSHSTNNTPRLNELSPWFRARNYPSSNTNEPYNTRSHSITRSQTVEKEFNEQGERKKVDFPFSKSNTVDIPRINPILRPLNQLSESEINKDTSKPSAFSPFCGKRDREKMQALEEEVFWFLASKLNRPEDEDENNEVEADVVQGENNPIKNNNHIPTQQLSESNEEFDSLKIDEDYSDEERSSDSPSLLPQQISPSWGMSNMSLHPKNYGYNNSNNIYPSSSMPSPPLFNPQFRSTSSPPQHKWGENRTNPHQETFLAGPPKRARKTTKPDERIILEEYYLEHNGKSRHTRSELESLANRIHWKISRIQRWLDNRRTKEKLLNLTKTGKKKGQQQQQQQQSPSSPTRQISFELSEQEPSNTTSQTMPHPIFPSNSFNRLSPQFTPTIIPFVHHHINDKMPHEKTINKIITYPTYSISMPQPQTQTQTRPFNNNVMWPPFIAANNNDNQMRSSPNILRPIPTTANENQAQPPSV